MLRSYLTYTTAPDEHRSSSFILSTGFSCRRIFSPRALAIIYSLPPSTLVVLLISSRTCAVAPSCERLHTNVSVVFVVKYHCTASSFYVSFVLPLEPRKSYVLYKFAIALLSPRHLVISPSIPYFQPGDPYQYILSR